jgi:LacI family transcriptional regulator
MHHLRTRSPARTQANLCGLLERWPEAPLGAENFLTLITAALRARAESLGYAFDLVFAGDYPSPARLRRVLASRGVEGIILLPRQQPTDLGRLLDWESHSVVTVTSSVVAPRFHAVTPNHFDNVLLACRSLVAAGFRRIGLAMPSDWDARVNHRWSGGIAWHNQFGGAATVPPLLDEGTGLALDPERISAWIRRERPDAVIFESIRSDAVRAAVDALPVRRRPRLVTLNWPNPAADCGVDQRVARIGEVAIETLAAMVLRGEKGIPALASQTMIPGRWVPGPG